MTRSPCWLMDRQCPTGCDSSGTPTPDQVRPDSQLPPERFSQPQLSMWPTHGWEGCGVHGWREAGWTERRILSQRKTLAVVNRPDPMCCGNDKPVRCGCHRECVWGRESEQPHKSSPATMIITGKEMHVLTSTHTALPVHLQSSNKPCMLHVRAGVCESRSPYSEPLSWVQRRLMGRELVDATWCLSPVPELSAHILAILPAVEYRGAVDAARCCGRRRCCGNGRRDEGVGN